MKKKLIFLLSVFVFYSLILTVIITLCTKPAKADKKTRIATSFYPIYIIAENLVEGCDDVTIENITSNAHGCLHDYQLSSADMKKLENADVLIINGGGMESFIEDAASIYPNLPIINSCKRISLLEAECEHDHEAEEHTKEDSHKTEDATHTDDETHEAEESHEHETNAHVWLNTSKYLEQIDNISKQLITLFPEYKKDIVVNTAKYSAKILSLQDEIKTKIKPSKNTNIIIFHDAFAYMADEIGLNVADSIEIEADTSLSAGQIADIVDNVKHNKIKYLFTEEQFNTTIADSISKETDAKVYVIDSLVSGDGSLDSYIDGMEKNIKLLESIL